MKKKRNWNKILTIVFLGMMVVGFSIPAFLDPGDNNAATGAAASDQKLCQTDSDCYLLCDDTPVEVLCSQNLCSQDSCDGTSYYKYQPQPLTFSLSVKVNGENIDLQSRSSSGNIFAKFDGDKVNVFASDFSLSRILEKAKISLDLQCLSYDGNNYCDKLKMQVNGKDSTLFGNYVPQEGDVVEIIYRL